MEIIEISIEKIKITHGLGLSGQRGHLGGAPSSDGSQGLGTVGELGGGQRLDLGGGEADGVRSKNCDVGAGRGDWKIIIFFRIFACISSCL